MGTLRFTVYFSGSFEIVPIQILTEYWTCEANEQPDSLILFTGPLN